MIKMSDIADSVPNPQTPSGDEESKDFTSVGAILGSGNYENGLHYTQVSVQRRRLEEPIDESCDAVVHRDVSYAHFSERERLLSFSKWTSEHPVSVSPLDLARNGFKYMGPKEQVYCVFCHKIFLAGNRDFAEHNIINCAARAPQNKPLSEEERHPSNSNIKAKYPAFVYESVRRHSFQHWPPSFVIVQKPENLAAAGFFYQPCIGKEDRVRCFVCGKLVYKWESHDIPWEEHRKISPNCLLVQDHFKHETACATSLPPQLSASIGTPGSEDFSEDDVLNNTAVKAVLQDFGSDYSMKQVLNTFQQLKIISGPEVTSQQLLEKLMEDEEQSNNIEGKDIDLA